MSKSAENQEQVPKEYLQAIGEVTVRWNALEGLLHLCLIKLLGKEMTEGRSHVVFAHMAFPQKLDVLSALIGELQLPPGHSLGRYKTEVQPLLKEAQTKRNLIIHSIYGVEEGRVLVSSVSARGSLKMKQEPITLEEMTAVSSLIVRAGATLFIAVTGHPPTQAPHNGQ